RARPGPVAGRQTQRLGGGAILGDDDNLRRSRQRAPEVEQHELAEPILQSATEQMRAQQQPGERGGEADETGNTKPGPGPPTIKPIVSPAADCSVTMDKEGCHKSSH